MVADLERHLGAPIASALIAAVTDQVGQRLSRAVRNLVAAGGDIRVLLYRVDVDERAAETALRGLARNELADPVAHLVWQRSLRKFASRARGH